MKTRNYLQKHRWSGARANDWAKAEGFKVHQPKSRLTKSPPSRVGNGKGGDSSDDDPVKLIW